jgi:hypothetical protein
MEPSLRGMQSIPVLLPPAPPAAAGGAGQQQATVGPASVTKKAGVVSREHASPPDPVELMSWFSNQMLGFFQHVRCGVNFLLPLGFPRSPVARYGLSQACVY